MTVSYVRRQIEPVLETAGREYPVVLVTGPRQVGKSTVVWHVLSQAGASVERLTLDDLDLRRLAREDPSLFFQLHEPPVFIDEVQYAPELFPQIKLLVDAGAPAGAFWLSGSQQFGLMQLAGESLAGRAAVVSLSSLSLRELSGDLSAGHLVLELNALKQRSASSRSVTASGLFQTMYRGAMPAVANGSRSNLSLFYSSYIQTYIERDVRQLLGSVDDMRYSDFMRSVAARCSQLLNVSAIAEDAQIRPDKAKEWLGVLERSGVIFYLHPYSNNQLRRTVKASKLYFHDCGLVAHLARWTDPKALAAGAMAGAFVENLVVSELCKGYINEGLEPPLYYYRDRDGREIDVVIEEDGELHPIEIKKTASPNRAMTRSFSALDRSLVPRGTGAVICMAERLSALDERTYVIPIWAL